MPCFALCFAFAFSRLSFSACFFFRQTKNIVFTNCAKESFTFSVDLGACDVSGNDGGGNGDGKDAVAAVESRSQGQNGTKQDGGKIEAFGDEDERPGVQLRPLLALRAPDGIRQRLFSEIGKIRRCRFVVHAEKRTIIAY